MNGMSILECEPFKRFGGVKCCVSMRQKSAPLEFSMALHTGQERVSVLSNRRVLEEFFPEKASFVSARQVHGDSVLSIDEKVDIGWESISDAPVADALISNVPYLVLTVLSADCLPILLYEPVVGAIGAVHAGWRGSDMDIVGKSVEMMKREYGASPKDMMALIGPGIGGCCYEVGEDVAARFEGYEGALRRVGESFRLDLKRVNLLNLVRAGVGSSKIHISPHCSSCERELFFSYRAQKGCAGRFMSCIMLNPDDS